MEQKETSGKMNTTKNDKSIHLDDKPTAEQHTTEKDETLPCSSSPSFQSNVQQSFGNENKRTVRGWRHSAIRRKAEGRNVTTEVKQSITSDGNVDSLKDARQDEVRIVLVGRTGEGKSATANTIFGKKVFKSEVSSTSVTAECNFHKSIVKGQTLCVIDTPGLFDTKKSNKETKDGILEYLAMSSPGPHVFLVVIKIGRFTKEGGETYKLVCEMFGNEIHQYTIVVFTGGDELEENEITIEQYLDNAAKGLDDILKKVSNRYVVFNNRAKGSEKEKQVHGLLQEIENMIKANRDCFRSETYKGVEKALQEIEKREAIIKEKEAEANALKEKLKAHQVEFEQYEFRERKNTLERDQEKSYREQQFSQLEREYAAKLRSIEDKYETQLNAVRDQTRNDIRDKKVDLSQPWFKGKIKGARHKLKSVLGLM